MRRDWWWLQPAGRLSPPVRIHRHATWAAFRASINLGLSLSFYSPELFGSSPHAWFGPKPGWWPAWLVFSPALLSLPFPGLFRLTCYYYRGAYYKAFWADPPACAVGEPRKEYCGEAAFPLIVQNIHRYFLYITLVFLAVLTYDVYQALWFTDLATGHRTFGIGIGTLVLAANVILLGGYTRGCHSLRHVIGGYRRPASPPRYAGDSTIAPAASTALTCCWRGQSVLRSVRGPVRADVFDGGWTDVRIL